MKRLCSALLLLVAGCGGVEVQGVVRDQSTGDPLPGATVRVGEDTTETDYRGYYELEVDEEDASQGMTIDKTGYESSRQDVSFEGTDEVIQDVELNPSLPATGSGTGVDSESWTPPPTTEPGTTEGEPMIEEGNNSTVPKNQGGSNDTQLTPPMGPGSFGGGTPGGGPR